MGKNVYAITDFVPVNYAGRTKSIINRLNVFDDNFNDINCNIVLTSFHRNYIKVKKKMKSQLNKDINVRGLYNELSGNSNSKKNNVECLEKELLNNGDFLKIKDGNIIYFYKENKLVHHIEYTAKKRLKEICDYNENEIIYKKYGIDSLRNICCVEYFDSNSENKKADVLVNENGEIYCRRIFNDKKKVVMCIVSKDFFGKNIEPKIYYDENDLVYDFLNTFIKDGDKIICDARKNDPAVVKLSDRIDTFHFIHNVHFHTENSKIRKVFNRLAKLLESNNGRMIVLTNEQKKDVIVDYPHLDGKIDVIPHYMNFINKNRDIPNNINKNFITISRLVDYKGIMDVIKGFEKISNEYPEYQLDIYGEGADKGKYEKYVKDNNLLNIHIHSFTDNPQEIMFNSFAFLSCSEYEGFGLSINEAVSNGCPVIAYDVKYGPKDIISNIDNCRLVEYKDIDTISKSMEFLIINSNKIDRKKIMEQAYENFNISDFIRLWKEELGL